MEKEKDFRQEEGGKKIEKEQRVNEFINLAVVKRREKENMELSEMVNQEAEELPGRLKSKVMEDYNRLRGKLSEEDLRIEMRESVRKAREAYMESSLQMPNKSFSRLEAISSIDSLFENEEASIEDTKKVARISFDLNGLKAANDLNDGDHNFGDEYLRLASEAIKSPKVIKMIEEKGLDDDFTISRDGGDEFGMILKSDKPITKEALEDIIKTIQDELWNSKKVPKILDMNSPKVLSNFTGKPVEEIYKYNNIGDFKEEHGIPRDFEYKGMISAGGSTLYESLLDEDSRKEEINSRDSYERILEKMMGGIFSTSDDLMKKDKNSFKERMAAGLMGKDIEDEEERKKAKEYGLTLSRIYSRTEEEKKLAKENQALKGGFDHIEELINKGGSTEDVIKIIKETKKLSKEKD